MKTIHVCYYLYVLLFSTGQFVIHASDDRLNPRESITVDEPLVSAGGSFSLGFFSPTNLSDNIYVGIWFNNMGPRRVVWVANREKPVKDSSAVLRFSSDGVLSILDAKGEVYWSAGGAGQVGSARSNTAAVLLDTGNLVIREGGNVPVWQSFDHPGDAGVPGMRIGFSRKSNNAEWRLTSWKDAEDPSPGNFSLDYDPKTTLQLYICRGSELYARGVMRNSYHDSFTEGVSFLVYETYIDTDDEFYVTVTVTDGSPKVWYRLDYTGQLQVEGWDDGSKRWVKVVSWPNKDCDLYGFCGPFGYCDQTKQAPTCSCLEGFEPRVWSDWNSGNFSAGCIRKKDLQCGSGGGDVFVTVQGLKVPANYEYLPNVTMDSCRAACLGNCSCTAYNQGSLATANTTIPRCLLWMGELIDSQKMISRWSEDLHLRVASSGSDKSATRRKIRMSIIILTIGGVVLLAAVTCLAWKLHSKDRSKNPKQGSFCANSKMELGGSDKKLGKAKSGKRKDAVGNTDGSIELPVMAFETILAATNNFSGELKIGQGGFGIVYLGTLPDGRNVAIKRLAKGSGQGLKEFNNEIILIAKLQHRNLVRLLGCCAEGDEKLLVYEYMPNKSLDAFLFDPTKKSVLDWAKRFNIIKGIARALLYLHQDSRLRIIHRDLKGSNILLDEEMNPKVSDFGMARIFGNDQNQANTNRVVGTYGYMAPEYAMEGRFSTKSDVYSFGVLVLELLSGSRNIGFDHVLGYPNLLTYAWSLWMDGRPMDFIDASIRESCSRDEASNCMHVGLLCIQDSPDDRPTISSIVLMLENESTSSATPKQPIFLPHRNPVLLGTHLDVQNLESDSRNDLTITTMVEGR